MTGTPGSLLERLEAAIRTAEGPAGLDAQIVDAFPHLFNDVLALRNARRETRARLSSLPPGMRLRALAALETKEVAIVFAAYWQDTGGEG